MPAPSSSAIPPPNPILQIPSIRTHATPEQFNNSVQEYYKQKQPYNELYSTWLKQIPARKDKEEQSKESGQSVKQEIPIRERRDDENKVDEDKKSFLNTTTSVMPVHPAEETASGNITDQVAKESDNSTASTHDLHDEDTNATSGGSKGIKATEKDHAANLGPVHADNLPEKAGKEELKAKAAEMNK